MDSLQEKYFNYFSTHKKLKERFSFIVHQWLQSDATHPPQGPSMLLEVHLLDRLPVSEPIIIWMKDYFDRGYPLMGSEEEAISHMLYQVSEQVSEFLKEDKEFIPELKINFFLRMTDRNEWGRAGDYLNELRFDLR